MSDMPPPPPAGGFPTDAKEAKAQAKAAKAHAKALRPWYKKKRYMLPLGLVALVVIIQAAGGGDDKTSKVASSDTTTRAADTTPQAEEVVDETVTTLSAADEMDDVTITSCDEQFGYMKVGLTVVNNSSKTSNYIITLSFVDASGTKVGDGFASTNNVEPGQTAKIEGMGTVSDGATGVTCKVAQVERYAS